MAPMKLNRDLFRLLATVELSTVVEVAGISEV